jgi:hypothetical protein
MGCVHRGPAARSWLRPAARQQQLMDCTASGMLAAMFAALWDHSSRLHCQMSLAGWTVAMAHPEQPAPHGCLLPSARKQ